MPAEVYEVVAQGARYWFLFLMLTIVWRSWRWYRRDQRQARKRRKLLPDAGYVGEMVVLEGGGALPRGTALPLAREGTLGALRTNDLCLPVPGVARRHLWFRFDDGVGLFVEPFGSNEISVDGEAFESRRTPLYMAHGSCLNVGTAVLRLRLFAGFESTARAPRREPCDPPPVREEAPAVQPDPAAQQYAAQQYAAQQYAAQQYAAQQYAAQQYAAQQYAAQQYAARQAYEQGYRQAMAQLEAESVQDAAAAGGDGMADPYSYEAARAQGRVDHSAFMRPAGEPPPRMPEAESEPAPQAEEPAVFYPPEMEEEADWEPAPECYDEDLTDAAAPPKSAYVGHDEAERAKRRVWDRYLGGGQSR